MGVAQSAQFPGATPLDSKTRGGMKTKLFPRSFLVFNHKNHDHEKKNINEP
jgi:hypothetical protein